MQSNIRAINYVADFLVKDGDKEIVVDAKGLVTPMFKLKEKMFHLTHSIFFFYSKKKIVVQIPLLAKYIEEFEAILAMTSYCIIETIKEKSGFNL